MAKISEIADFEEFMAENEQELKAILQVPSEQIALR
jgi:hypothetical protein